MFSLTGEYSDVFTSEHCQVGDTSWVEFKIELNEHAKPVKQKFRPLRTVQYGGLVIFVF